MHRVGDASDTEVDIVAIDPELRGLSSDGDEGGLDPGAPALRPLMHLPVVILPQPDLADAPAARRAAMYPPQSRLRSPAAPPDVCACKSRAYFQAANVSQIDCDAAPATAASRQHSSGPAVRPRMTACGVLRQMLVSVGVHEDRLAPCLACPFICMAFISRLAEQTAGCATDDTAVCNSLTFHTPAGEQTVEDSDYGGSSKRQRQT